MLKVKDNIDLESLQDLGFSKGRQYWNNGNISVHMVTRDITITGKVPMRVTSFRVDLPDVLLTMFEKGMVERG